MFDIYQLDENDDYDAESEEALDNYQNDLLQLFAEAPEGKEYREKYPEMGFWAAQLIYYGYAYVGVTIPQMTVGNVKEIISDLFPRKISLLSLDEAKDALPELITFWRYLEREYKLPNASVILKYLNKINEDEFVRMMNDPSRFGMAKSFIMAGNSAGFDMSNEDEMNAFMNLYNASQIGVGQRFAEEHTAKNASHAKQDKTKKKRKAAKIARKRNRK